MLTRIFPIAAAALLCGLGSTALANPELAKAKNCTACHAVDRKMIGPAYREVAARYASDKDAVAKLTKKVREGGAGAWGPVPMPPNPQVNEAEAEALVKWVLSAR
jgi:cytochrome c